jgi:hypothetical protein
VIADIPYIFGTPVLAYLSGAPCSSWFIFVASNIRLEKEMSNGDKHSSLLLKSVTFTLKSFISSGPETQQYHEEKTMNFNVFFLLKLAFILRSPCLHIIFQTSRRRHNSDIDYHNLVDKKH